MLHQDTILCQGMESAPQTDPSFSIDNIVRKKGRDQSHKRGDQFKHDPLKSAFHFDEVQSMQWLESEAILYATFTTAESGIAGGAVCSYNLSSIEEAMASKFLKRDDANSVWKVESADHSTFECDGLDSGGGATRNPRLVTSNEYQLVSKPARPVTKGPIYHVRFFSPTVQMHTQCT